MNLSKGFKNIFSPTLINLFIALTLIIIIILIYLKNKNIDLFTDDYLDSIINKIKTNQEQKIQFATRLATQEQTILNLQNSVSNIL